MNATGLCECGCGQRTTVASETHSKFGWVKGQPLRFVRGHSRKGRTAGNPLISSEGYRIIPVAGREGRVVMVGEHVLLAERATGRRLPPSAQVHHLNEDPADNRPSNLVVCQDAAYHKLLHVRATALRACGHAGWRKCWKCQQWDAPERLTIAKKYTVHPACRLAHERAYKARRKAVVTGELDARP